MKMCFLLIVIELLNFRNNICKENLRFRVLLHGIKSQYFKVCVGINNKTIEITTCNSFRFLVRKLTFVNNNDNIMDYIVIHHQDLIIQSQSKLRKNSSLSVKINRSNFIWRQESSALHSTDQIFTVFQIQSYK